MEKIDNIEEDLKTLRAVLFLAAQNPDSDLFDGTDFVTRVLKKKFEAFRIPMEIPNWLGFVIGFCVDGNPAYCQVVMDEILSAIDKEVFHGGGIEDGYIIKLETLGFCYPEFILMSKPEVCARIVNKSDSFKKCGRYEFDTFNFWAKHFKSLKSDIQDNS